MNLPAPLEAFFFRRMGSRGFSLMRISWAFFVGIYLLMQWNDVTYYYSNAGILPQSLESLFVRSHYRFTVLEWVDQPVGVFCLYLILLSTLFSMMIGLWPRLMTIMSVLLLFSFHERNPMILGGGDTLLRTIGFLLMIAPGIDGFSVMRLHKQWTYWKQTHRFLPAVTMPIWPWRLLLWQMIVLYGTSLWYKLLGTMWLNGTAVEATFHHPVFARFSPRFINILMPAVGIGDYLALFWQGAWLGLLIPRSLAARLPRSIPRIPFLRLLIMGGVLFHTGILILMDAGVFSFAVFTAYLGLLRDEDFAWMRRVLSFETRVTSTVDISQNSKLETSRSTIVLYDGHCGLCLRSLFTLQILDWRKNLQFVDFRDINLRRTVAPDLNEEELDKAMHIKLSDDEYRKGFDAFRAISWHLPPLWLIAPFLYIPGIPWIGRRIYAHIAANRKKCDHASCAL